MSFTNTKIKLIVWFVIFALLTSFVVYEFMLLDSVRNSTAQMEQEIIQENDSLQAYDSLVRTFSNIKDDSERANMFFIKKDEVVNFLEIIEALSKITSTQISIQNVADKGTASSSSVLSVDVNARGSYSNLHYLLRLLEELPYQTEVQSVSFTNEKVANNKSPISNSWVANMTIVGVIY